MDIQSNKAAVLKLLKAIGKGDAATVTELLTPDATWWVSGDTVASGSLNKHAFCEMIAGVPSLFPNLIDFEVGLMTAEDDRVCAEAKANATLKDGREYKNTYHYLFIMRDGQVAVGKEYMDTDHVSKLFS